jgi:hypothetical protein
MRSTLGGLLVLLLAAPAAAGLHYTGETYRDLPARWTGYLPDQRLLRALAAPANSSIPLPPLRDQYADTASKLEALARTRPLSADEAADLGALLVRLGQPDRAVALLRPAARQHPDHFRLAANLGTASQLTGDLAQAADSLEEAVRLAPDRWKEAEALHLKLVRLRMREGKKPADAPDDLFGPKPPTNALALAQQLALWLPADGRLLWLLGELAYALGDVRSAAAILDGCVIEFALPSPTLRDRRVRYRNRATELEKKGHAPSPIAFKSPRALARSLDPARLPPIRPDGLNPLPWAAVGETEIGPRGKPAFLDHVEKLDGKRVTILGYVTPAGNATAELTGFLLTENPVGCWFCETPGPTQVLTVELADGLTTEPTRQVIKVTGTLKLYRNDPERFPFSIVDARVGPAD